MGRENESQTEPEESDQAGAKEPDVVCYSCGGPLLTENEILKETCANCQDIVDQGD
jgi:hypothetical protein